MKSKCCNARIKTITGGEGTSHWGCTKCEGATDPKATPPQQTGTDFKSTATGVHQNYIYHKQMGTWEGRFEKEFFDHGYHESNGIEVMKTGRHLCNPKCKTRVFRKLSKENIKSFIYSERKKLLKEVEERVEGMRRTNVLVESPNGQVNCHDCKSLPKSPFCRHSQGRNDAIDDLLQAIREMEKI